MLVESQNLVTRQGCDMLEEVALFRLWGALERGHVGDRFEDITFAGKEGQDAG